jgi:hypothetical protein
MRKEDKELVGLKAERGRSLAGGDAVARAHKHIGAGDGNGGSVFSIRRESEEEGRNESSSRLRGVLRASQTDQWGRGWRTAAMARPRGGNGLRPVGHNRLKKLNGSPKMMTDRATSSLIIS